MRLLNTELSKLLFEFFTGRDISPDTDTIAATGWNAKGSTALLLIMTLLQLEEIIYLFGILAFGIAAHCGAR